MSYSIAYRSGSVHYQMYGRGARRLLVLHGFARSGRRFESLARRLGPEYTIIAPDLPYHGQTEWPGGVFDRTQMREALDTILDEQGWKRFALFGHSFGGRIALSLATEWGDRLEALYLAAPDGLRQAITTLPEKVPARLVDWSEQRLQHPRLIIRLLTRLQHQGRLSDHYFEYIQQQLSDPVGRKRAFSLWRSVYHFRLHKRRLAAALTPFAFPIHLIAGQKDWLLPPAKARRIVRLLPRTQLHEVPTGHSFTGGVLARVIHANWPRDNR